MRWVTSDHHFGHKNIIKYCNRSFDSAEEMDRIMIDRWNDVVKYGDTVYHLGDFSMKKKKEDMTAYLQRVEDYVYLLKGRIILIMGNHDHEPEGLRDIFDEVYEDHLIIDEEDRFLYLSHRRVTDMPTLNVSVERWDYYPIPLPSGRKNPIQLCGHVHELWGINTEYMTPTQKEIAKDALYIWRRLEGSLKDDQDLSNETWQDGDG